MSAFQLRSARRRAVVAALALAVVCAASSAALCAGPALAAPTGGSRTDSYRPPTQAPVVDPFRRPLNPFAAGNRGLEYGTSPGDPLRSIGGGVVTFAGRIAGRMYVTVLHPDGLRSSLSYLARLAVRQGQSVRAGQVLGWAGTTNAHLGVRTGALYLDPAMLFAAGRPRHAVLVRSSPVVGDG